MATTTREIAPARLYVLLAREAPTAVILRRGPSPWVQVIRWNTCTDTFQPGHWFYGRIYNERCDLSPSGDKLIYFAAKHISKRRYDPTYTSTWTAISKTPYLTALALWPNRGGTYFGGGLFETEESVWLNSLNAVYFDPPQLASHPNHLPPDELKVAPNPFAFVHPFYPRLLRNGWTWHKDGRHPASIALWDTGAPPSTLPRDLYRQGGERGAVLHCRLEYYWAFKEKDRYWIQEGTSETALDEVDWADWDQQGRLVCARAGKLFEIGQTTRQGKREWRELADFNDARPRLIPPPEWAKSW